MIKGLVKNRKPLREPSEADRLLNLQLSEIEELSSLLMSRIDERVKALKEIEKRIDEKKDMLQRLLIRAENISSECEDLSGYRYREVMVLAGRGLKVEEIANLLDLPVGEVELLINMSE